MNVRAVLNHTVGGMRIFTAAVTGGTLTGQHEDDWLGDGARRAFHDAAIADRATWRREGALSSTVRIWAASTPSGCRACSDPEVPAIGGSPAHRRLSAYLGRAG